MGEFSQPDLLLFFLASYHRLGHYMFKECGDVVNPTLGLKVDETYTFVQDDRTNCKDKQLAQGVSL